jgi:hypothetical protein
MLRKLRVSRLHTSGAPLTPTFVDFGGIMSVSDQCSPYRAVLQEPGTGRTQFSFSSGWDLWNLALIRSLPPTCLAPKVFALRSELSAPGVAAVSSEIVLTAWTGSLEGTR